MIKPWMMPPAAGAIYVDDVFSAYTRNGTGASAAVTTGVNLSVSGGLVWAKARSAATGHRLQCTAIGAGTELITETTGASAAAAQGVTSFDSAGYTIGTDTDYNNSTGPITYVDWTFRNAPRFFTHTTVTKSAGSNATVDLSTLGTVGMVAVKRTDSTGSWYVWHRSLTAGKLLYLEQTAAEATLGHITVSGTTLTLVNGVIADGSYVVYAWAHDATSDGLIQCGSFTTDASGNATVTLGWEPQYLMIKSIQFAGGWNLLDVARGWGVGGNDLLIQAQSTAAETAAYNFGYPTATGFNAAGLGASEAYIYLAIRRPNKPPTSGVQVYNAIARTGTGAAATVTGVGFAPDMLLSKPRVTGYIPVCFDRLRGATRHLSTYQNNAEVTAANSLTSFSMDGYDVGTDATHGGINFASEPYINHFFKRATGFFDEVCDTGTGAAHTIGHNLTAAPELMIRKGRSGATQWEVWHSGIANTEKLVLNATSAKATDTTAWNSTSPTASVFTVGTGANVNTNTATYVTYLFATLAGISKVFSYTGNGSSQTINCGFTAGARFILIKRTDSTGDWFTWDSVRGIVAGNDPHLSLNTTAAEVTTDDSIDPDNSGFVVNQNATTNINVTSATYIGLAIA